MDLRGQRSLITPHFANLFYTAGVMPCAPVLGAKNLEKGVYEPILQLYKKLCRHYYYINPAATADYVNIYREMWDSEENEEQKVPVKRCTRKGAKKLKKISQ